jgi:hypothetical protein
MGGNQIVIKLMVHYDVMRITDIIQIGFSLLDFITYRPLFVTYSFNPPSFCPFPSKRGVGERKLVSGVYPRSWLGSFGIRLTVPSARS